MVVQIPHRKFYCHPERLKKIEDFRKESKDLRTEYLQCSKNVRRSFDSLRSLRMTNIAAAANTCDLRQPLFY